MKTAQETGRTPAQEADPGTERGALRALLPVLDAHRTMTVRTFVAALVDQAALVALVTLTAHTVGTAVVERQAPGPVTIAALLVLVAVRALATWREMDLSHDLAYRVLAELRVRVFDGLARSAPARIKGRRSGDLASAALGDVEALEFFYAHAVAQLLASGVVFGGGSVALALLEPWLLLPVLPVAALLALAPVLESRGRAVRGARTRAAAAELSAEAVESVDGLRELLAFGALDARRERLRAHGRALGAAQRSEQAWEADAAAVRDLLVVAAVVGVVLAAAHTVAGAWAPAAMALALGVLAPVADSAAALGQAGGLRAAASRVGAAVRAPAGAPAPAAPRPLPEGPLGVRLRGVRFDYGDRAVLDGLDLTVGPGETLALVGVSGAGKSTCAHLLARFWDPASGTVELVPESGPPVDLRDLAEPDLRGAVSVVGQDAPLFHGTLAENLRLAAPDADAAAFAEAARVAGVDRIAAELPDGYGTRVGERGTTLSGGQRARIALARALMTRPRVLVLDETTANLDTEGDAAVSAALTDGAHLRTTVVVAHRPSTIRRADRVAVLESGRVVQTGTWAQLVAEGGAFARVLARRG
ncbi:ABC transporter ATP-binding protein [Streptomyces pristinaespiralis]|uniref:ABC transporter ATPase n=2 Tax=Streptomyces pristinaespiralis TaxID=38300 RepID=A0A0M4DFN8_STRPR|nr:ABC transporter ATPase [Streptomyces pristinaespiralis]QMU17145.1 ABC transporter ATP-binding protein/permease [Streptomyces pristinaespiralis]